jgi:Fur family peroxide stress response transcriptional regulator
MDAQTRKARIAEFEQTCRERGLALTVQRRTILEAVLDRDDHPTADQVYEAVQERVPGVSRTTVYRVLETLVDTGAVMKACTPGSATRYDATIDLHHHLVCLTCGKLVDVEDTAVRSRIDLPEDLPRGFEIEGYSIRFHGICGSCRKQKDGKARGSSKKASAGGRGKKR